MKALTQIHSLKTTDPAAGVALAAELARDISINLTETTQSIPKPGGMNYTEPAAIPRELIASILLVAVSIANEGWAKS